MSGTDHLEHAPVSGKTKWFALGALVVAGGAFAALAFGGLGENLVYYWGPTQIHEAGDKAYGATIRLGGMVAPGSIRYEEGGSGLTFDVKDGGNKVTVHSSGVPPQMFRENIGVVVEGTMVRSSGVFESNRLMVSHSNEYRAPRPGEAMPSMEEMIKTTQGVSGETAR